MPLTTLKDDLLQEFREERVMINEQIELLDPLATSLRKPAAQRLLSSGTLIITEIGCYIVSLGGLAFIAFMHRIYPFGILGDIFYNAQIRNSIGTENLMYLILAIYGLAAIGVTLMFIIGRMAREIRLKNDILNHAGTDIKKIAGQHLKRKAALDTIEQRHLLGVISGIGQPPPKVAVADERFSIGSIKIAVNEVRNPGFG
ncbi:MAG: hypothetical protein ACHQD8_04550 [Chitinophagales bacterium]